MNNSRKEIRFIDSNYRELFRIPDGKSIVITYPDGKKLEKECTFLDEYHTKVGISHFHICQFAERMEAIGATYQPAREPVKQQSAMSRAMVMAGGTQSRGR